VSRTAERIFTTPPEATGPMPCRTAFLRQDLQREAGDEARQGARVQLVGDGQARPESHLLEIQVRLGEAPFFGQLHLVLLGFRQRVAQQLAQLLDRHLRRGRVRADEARSRSATH